MKTIMSYQGYIIKQVIDMDVKKKDIPDYKLGEFYVYTKDNEIEYDGCETLEEAKQQIDGLKIDKMETKKSKLAKNLGLNNEIRDPDNYKFKSDLNWEDDGDELTDPSMNDYLKGYQIDPYDFKQWASNKKGITKESAKETDNMQMLPWYLADKILTLWNGADGQLQSFFEAFTLRYSNKMKIELAKFLDLAGHKVYPVLIQEKPLYASRLAGNIKPYYDMQMSDIVLDKTEETMSGNKDPIGVNKGSDGPFGYNATDYLNSDVSVSPNNYETRLDGNGWYRGSRLKKKL